MHKNMGMVKTYENKQTFFIYLQWWKNANLMKYVMGHSYGIFIFGMVIEYRDK